MKRGGFLEEVAPAWEARIKAVGWGTVHTGQSRTVPSQKMRAASHGGWSPHGPMEQELGAQPGATVTTAILAGLERAIGRNRKPPTLLVESPHFTEMAWHCQEGDPVLQQDQLPDKALRAERK